MPTSINSGLLRLWAPLQSSAVNPPASGLDLVNSADPKPIGIGASRGMFIVPVGLSSEQGDQFTLSLYGSKSVQPGGNPNDRGLDLVFKLCTCTVTVGMIGNGINLDDDIDGTMAVAEQVVLDNTTGALEDIEGAMNANAKVFTGADPSGNDIAGLIIPDLANLRYIWPQITFGGGAGQASEGSLLYSLET